MSKVITIINMKGGVGKTTLSVNIAYVLAKFHDQKVLLIDIDPQFNATQYLVEQSNIIDHFKTKKTVYDILMPVREEDVTLSAKKKTSKAKPEVLGEYLINIVKYDNGSTLDLIPSSLKLINFETTKRGVENRLKKFISEKCKHYDFVIIDCPPTLSILTLSAYLASEHYLIPIKPDYLSSLGLPLLERGLEEYEELYGHSLNLLGIIFTMINLRPKVTEEIMEEIKGSGRHCFDNSSTHSTRVAESVESNISSLVKFYTQGSSQRYSREFKAIVDELLSILV